MRLNLGRDDDDDETIRMNVRRPAGFLRSTDAGCAGPGGAAAVVWADRLRGASAARTVSGMDVRLPPGPRLPNLLQALLALAAPVVLFPAAAKRYGVPFTLTMLPQRRKIVAVAEP